MRFHPRVLLALAVSIVLVAGVVSPAEANSFTQTRKPPAHSRAVTSLPPLPVKPGKPYAPPSIRTKDTGAPAVDLVAPTPAPANEITPPKVKSAFDPQLSVPISRTAYETLYLNPDGSKTKELSATPINVKKADGSWTAVATSIAQNSKTGAFAVANNPLSPTFGATLGTGADYSVNNGSTPMTVTLVGTTSVKGTRPAASALHTLLKGDDASAAASALLYPNALPGQDLQYQVTESEVKETLVLKSVPSAELSTWTWLIHAPGLTMSHSDRSSLYLTDANGVVQYSIPDPIMWDSSTESSLSLPNVENVPYTFAQTPNGDWALTLTPDRSWLTDPARVYPVMVDPTATYGLTTQVAYRYGGSVANINYTGRDTSARLWRTVAYYDYTGMRGSDAANWYYEVLPGSYFGITRLGGESRSRSGGVYSAANWAWTGYGGIGLTGWTLGTGTVNGVDSGVSSAYQAWINQGSAGGTLMWLGDESQVSEKQLSTTLYMSYGVAPVVTPVAPTATNGVPTNNGRGPVMPNLAVTSTNPAGGALNYSFSISTNANPTVSPAWASGWTASSSVQVPKALLTSGVKYYWKASVQDAYGAIRSTQVQSFTANTPGVIGQTNSYPADKSVVSTLTPTLTVPTAGTDANGDPLQYQFRLTTGSDAISGQVVSSPLGSALSWQVPAGILRDGTAYSWTVVVSDGYDNWVPWVSHFAVSLRVASAGPAPTDSAGPVTVNLANGNVSTSFASPTVSTIGGSMGLAFNYNSQATSNAGLVGSYYNAVAAGSTTPVFTFPPANPVLLTRPDATLSFDWSTQPPVPGFPMQNFMAQWNGYITPPEAGSYKFGFLANDTASLFLGGSSTAEFAVTASTGSDVVYKPTETTLAAGPTPIKVQFTDGTSLAHLQLWVQYTPTGGSQVTTIVPGTWFTQNIVSLPGGWTGSQPMLGGVSYVAAQNNGGSVVLTDVGGGAHTYTQTAGGGYTPPAGEAGVVSVVSGVVNFTDEAGTVYVFNVAGQLVSATGVGDPLKPTKPVPAYSSSGQLLSLTDPLSVGMTPLRQVTFTYATTANGTGGGVCAPPSGTSAALEAPPIGYLCQISYPLGDPTKLYYDLNGQLAIILNPGNERADFGYTQVNGQYLLSTVRGSLANDWLAADSSRSNTGPVASTIHYDGSGRADSVTLPAPDGDTPSLQPKKTYIYDTPSTPTTNGLTYVDVDGLTVPTTGGSNGHARTVTFSPTMQGLTNKSASGLTSQSEWNASDLPTASIDAQERKNTVLYDSLNRPTDTYGPALTSCFTGLLPNGTCASPAMAHSSTTYDGGLKGLNVAYYANTTLSGAPAAFTLGVDVNGDGGVNQTFSGAPIAGVPATNFSAQLTGTIAFPSNGLYTLTASADDYEQVYINDVLIATTPNSTTAGTGTFTATTAGALPQIARIRIVYIQTTGTAGVHLNWTPPGGSSVPVPGTSLAPAYGLVTATHTDDSAPTGISGVSSTQIKPMDTLTNYGSSPWLGQVASSSVDPAGLNLTSSATYENVSTLYGRQLTSLKPAGSGTTSTNAYYSPTDTVAALGGGTSPVCGLASTTPQYGMLKSTTGPTPATGSAIITLHVYDQLGRAVGSKRGSDDWSCVTYDARSKVLSTAYAAYGAGATLIPAHTTTNDYGINYTTGVGNPLITSVSGDTVTGTKGSALTTTVDLLGRTVSSTDVWGTVTTPAYEDKTGRVMSVETHVAGQTPWEQSFDYDLDGQVEWVKLDGTLIADPYYDPTTHLLTSVSYPTNGAALSAISRDANTGATVGLSWSFPAQDSVSDSVVRSQSGRILQNVLTDGTATSEYSSYTYDAAGRLTEAKILAPSATGTPLHDLLYGFAATTGCAANAAGKDGNRTSLSDSKNGGTATTVSYCYDNADRLVSTTASGAVSGASPITDGLTAGTDLVYDAHGNTTALADQTMVYDVVDNHVSTTVAGGPTVVYTRNVSGAVVERASATDATPVVRYTAGAVLDGSGNILQRSVSLPGGVSVQITGSGQSWSFPNLHGDSIIQTDGSGVRQLVTAGGSITRASYDPFGQPISANGDIGTGAADDAVADTLPGEADFSWVGSHSKLYEHQGSIATIEMGARQYVAALGRFLEVDPIPGGNSNAYDYPDDPINKFDLSGEITCPSSVPASVCAMADRQWKYVVRTVGPSFGPPTPTSKPKPDCSLSSCRTADYSIAICDFLCITPGISFREDGAAYTNLLIGIGPRENITYNVGSSTSTGNGPTSQTVQWSCGAAAGLGYYVGGALGFTMGEGLMDPKFSYDTQSGGLYGGGLGCSAGLNLAMRVPWT